MAIGNQNKDEGEWVIVGGTGFFTFAQGTITIRTEIDSGSSNIKEICICAFGCTGLSTPVQSESLGTEYNQIWYMHQIISGPNHNQVNIADAKQPQAFGFTNVHDYPIYDSLGPGKKIVARVQGLHTKTSMSGDGWFHWSKVAFDYERFQGSSFNAIGDQEGEWAIVGGTGDFTFAQGTVATSRVRDSGSSNIKKICIRAYCCPTNTPIGAKVMPKPGSGPVTLQSLITEYNRILYMHQIINGPEYNQVNIADPMQPNAFGYTNVHDYPMYDRLGPGRKLVARAQGLHTKTSMKYDGWFHWSSIVFSDERFQQGSSFKVIGNQEGEWAIVGGTGAFTFAQGTITTYRIQDNGFSNIKEICIHALCYTTYYSK
ncbi:hypothetical protein HU200_067602 [Digitaria exilis]|uniref:Dirigent protein n=1 Tax=Digitaria exilis TaxID=1010633 RepID=A0A834ZZ97_9POAL|nr:hypothetical protein HU200_067602 [Digitaria exilis]